MYLCTNEHNIDAQFFLGSHLLIFVLNDSVFYCSDELCRVTSVHQAENTSVFDWSVLSEESPH